MLIVDNFWMNWAASTHCKITVKENKNWCSVKVAIPFPVKYLLIQHELYNKTVAFDKLNDSIN